MDGGRRRWTPCGRRWTEVDARVVGRGQRWMSVRIEVDVMWTGVDEGGCLCGRRWPELDGGGVGGDGGVCSERRGLGTET